MKKKNNKKWTLVLVLLLVVSIGYAALASNLKINGTSGVKSATWDIYWNNVQVTQGSVEVTQGNGARITDQAKTQVEYSVTLNEPGDFYEFTVDAVNNGTIDAMIASEGIVNGVYSDANYQNEATLPDAIKYSVTYADGTTIEPKHLLAKKTNGVATTETYKVRIEYRNDNDVDPEDLEEVTDQTYYFKFSVNYVQADNTKIARNGGNQSSSAIRYLTRQNEGQITPGDVIGIGETENFYVISSNSEKTVLLAEYNLLMGYSVNDWNATPIDTSIPGYGLQSVDAVGYSSDWNGATIFSTSNYWMNGKNLLSPYNENDTIYLDYSSQNLYEWKFRYRNDNSVKNPYIYDENSILYGYISGENGYISKLIEMGAPSTITGRLLSYEEAYNAKEIGRVDSEYGYSSIIYNGQCSWLGSANKDDEVWCIDSRDPGMYGYSLEYDKHFGIRPVIEIPTSELD